MNWEALGAISELLGVIAILISIAYLARQIKHGVGVSEAQAFQTIFNGLAAHQGKMFGADHLDTVYSGFQSFEELPAKQRLQFDGLMAGLFNFTEGTYVASQAELLGDEAMENWAWFLRERILPYAGCREWWQATKPMYPRSFQAWVDRQVDACDQERDFYGFRGRPERQSD